MQSTVQVEHTGSVGRPTTYTPDVVATILSRMADGESLRSICQDEDMPCKVTFFRWLMRHQELKEAYIEAREMQADSLFEEVLEVGREDPQTSKTFDEDGNMISERVDSGEVQHRKLKIDTLKWAAGKLRPKKYGDLTQVQGDVSHRHYVAALPARTAKDPAEWAKQVEAERVSNGEIAALPAPAVEPEEEPEPAPPPSLPQRKINGHNGHNGKHNGHG
jgi:hypothetical protein